MSRKQSRDIDSMHRSPRCGAKTRKGSACRSPAVWGKKRCRMHGGAYGSGAPKGNRNAFKHGYYSKEAIAERRRLGIDQRAKTKALPSRREPATKLRTAYGEQTKVKTNPLSYLSSVRRNHYFPMTIAENVLKSKRKWGMSKNYALQR